MAKISKNGLTDIKNRLKTILESIAETLETNGNLGPVNEQISALFELISEIENSWEIIED